MRKFEMLNTEYEDLALGILEEGKFKGDRTGTGTKSVFGHQMRFSLENGTLPLVTTKLVSMRLVIIELLWLISGSTNVKVLEDQNCKIWSEWADPQGDLGPVYGKQWRSWDTPIGVVDQLADVIHQIKTNPNSRRLIVSAWNVADLEAMALPPCHLLFQFYVAEGKLSCQLYQRSADVFLGVPFNIASYALLTHMIAKECNLLPGEFIWTGGDCHIYSNHFEQMEEQVHREIFEFPTVALKDGVSFFDYKLEDFTVHNYKHGDKLVGKVAV